MGDADENSKQPASVPSWQQAASQSQPQPAEDSSPETPSSETILDRARIFLQDEEVRNSSKEKKAEFLRSKGLDEADIAKLLDESSEPTTAAVMTTATAATTEPTTELPYAQSSSDSQPGHPPIVTYPEFLTKPTKPPPLITASGLLNALTLIGGASTLVYGATKHIVSPMVAALTAARVDLHQAADANLSRLVGALEGAVSEIPASYYNTSNSTSNNNNNNNNKKPPATRAPSDDNKDGDESDSIYDDPTELFHRDVGVQTSPRAPSTPLFSSYLSSSNNNNNKPAAPGEQTQHQADHLARLSLAGRTLAADLVRHSEDLAETKNVLDALGSDLHALTYPPESFATGGSSYLYGVSAARSEPEDEIKRVKMNIRGVKGVLLSTRSFPATTR